MAQQTYLYKKLVSELTNFAVFLIDPEGCIVSWNPGVKEILGFGEAEWLEHSIDIIFTQEDRAQGIPEQEMKTALRDGRVADVRWHLRRDARRIFVDGTLMALRDDAGALLGYAKVLRDLTERNIAEQKLKDSLAYALSITDTIREPLLVLDGDLRVQLANQAFYQTFRVLPEATEGKLLYHLGDGQWDIPALRHLLEKVLPEKVTVESYEVQHVFPVIGPKLMRVNARKLWREGNHAEQILVAFEDFTAQRQAELDLKASEQRQLVLADLGERLRDLKDIPSIMHAAMELVGQSLEVDLAGFGLVDHASEQVMIRNSWTTGKVSSVDGLWSLADFGEQISSRLQLGESTAISDVMSDPLTRGMEQHWETIELRASLNIPVLKNGQLVALFFLNHSQPRNWVREEIRFLRKVADRTWAAVEREQLSLDRERLTKELSRSNQELTQFANIAAHDLQAPLRGVVSYSQLLQRQASGTLNESHREFLDMIVSSSKRMQELVHSILRFAQVGHGEIERSLVSMETVLKTTLINLEAQLSETDGEVTSSALPSVVGNEIQLIQLLQNLVGNGLKYSRPGSAPRVEVSAREHKDEFVFEVKDNGEGISAQYFTDIFEPLKRLHGADVPGSGMGLATCSRIVERHGGRIWVESIEGAGSSFWFTVPKATGPALPR